jgi:hypothetical protein
MNDCCCPNLKSCGLLPGLAISVLLLLVHIPHSLGQTAELTVEDSGALTLAQFRTLVEGHLTQATRITSKSRDPQPVADSKAADEVFLQLLIIQARDAVVQRSRERLSEWSRSIQARLRVQTAPQLDVDAIRFAEGRMSAESARIESAHAQIVERANSLLGRPPDAALRALRSDSENRTGDTSVELSDGLLAQGEELLDKLYQSYQFGGIPLSALLWHEQDVYRAELDYQLGLVRQVVGLRSETGRR